MGLQQQQVTPPLVIGDVVRIKPTTPGYGNSLKNPKNTDGMVTNIQLGALFPVTVAWDNGTVNVYKFTELIYMGAGYWPDDDEDDLPPLPNWERKEKKEEKCTCDLWRVVNFGCSCEAGKKELEKEREKK